MKVRISRHGLALLALLPLALGAAMSGVEVDHDSPARPRAQPQVHEDVGTNDRSAPADNNAATPAMTPAGAENSSPAAAPAQKNAPASPTRVDPDEAMGPSFYARSPMQPGAQFETAEFTAV